MSKRTCLKDIAQKVGVSTALVSYVLNNKKEGRISKEIAQKIRETATELHYRTNQIAKSLKTNKTSTIGLIVSDISNPFSSALARIIEDEADKKEYTVIFGSSDENVQKSGKLMDTLLNRQVDGLILAPPEGSEMQILDIKEQDIPFVLIDRYFPGIETNYVGLDNFDGSLQAVNHLVDIGRKRVGLVTYDSTLFNLTERLRGYQAGLSANGIECADCWVKKVNIHNFREEIEQSVQELVSQEEPVDAILFGTNVLASIGLKYINANGIKVPDDLAIISFDETDALDLFYAPLTYIRQPLREMGQAAMKILLDCMAGSTEFTRIDMPSELVIRASTGRKLEFVF